MTHPTTDPIRPPPTSPASEAPWLGVTPAPPAHAPPDRPVSDCARDGHDWSLLTTASSTPLKVVCEVCFDSYGCVAQ